MTQAQPGWVAQCQRLFLGRPQGRQRHLDALDGLRGLAVLVVIGSHLSNAGMLPRPGLSGTGKCGVYLFFVLSAFLLTRILLQRSFPALVDARLWVDYALRRVLRIWPLYLFVLLLSWLLTRQGVAGWHFQMDDAALWHHLLLREGHSVLWSIPVEFNFYLWLPPLVVAMAWLRPRCPGWLQAVLGASLLAAVMTRWPPAATGVNDVRLGPYLAVFLCGAFAARIDLEIGGRSSPGVWPWVGLGVLGLAACVVMAPIVWAWLLSRSFDPAISHTWFLAYGLAWSMVLLGVLHGPAWFRAPFSWKPMRLVGVVSFSAYLWHMPVLEAVGALGWEQRSWVASALVLALTLAVSMVSFLVLERPWREVRMVPGKPGRNAH